MENRFRVQYVKLVMFLALLTWAGSRPALAQLSDTGFVKYKQQVPGSSLLLTMVPIPGGSFMMGSPEAENGREADEGPQVSIAISPFWMSAFELTRDAFDVFYTDASISDNSVVDAVTKPSPQYIDFSLGMGKEGGFPVNSMSQYTALMYCRWLYQKTGVFYRLPTEAEWEYACRAGSSTPYFFGTDAREADKYAWFESNSKKKFHKVGEKLPNAWGLYDMLGNVMEWTMDHFDAARLSKLTETPNDPAPFYQKARYPKALRGGGFNNQAEHLRSANRYRSDPEWNRRDPQIPKSRWWLTEAKDVGFRIIRPLSQPTAEEAEAFFKLYLGV